VRGPLARFRTLQIYARIIGWSAAFRVQLHDRILRRLNFQPACEIQLKLKNANYPLKMRTGKSSDREVLEQIFIRSEYEPVVLVNPNTIIDLEANVGYSSAYSPSRYLSTRVVAVEPDRENFLICRQNLAPFGARATVLHGAAWPNQPEFPRAIEEARKCKVMVIGLTDGRIGRTDASDMRHVPVRSFQVHGADSGETHHDDWPYDLRPLGREAGGGLKQNL
jgi:hypothetical protein